MYFYLYDVFLRDKRYASTLAKIEGRLLALGIQGKSEKLTVLKSMKEIVDAALKRGATTIVAVGDDQTLSKLISCIAEKDVVLGIIPIGQHTDVAHALGIPKAEKACDVLSARIVELLDLGKANTSYFLSFLNLPSAKDLLIECEQGQYHIEPDGSPHAVSVYNFGHRNNNPRDGELELVIERSEQRQGMGRIFQKQHAHASVFPTTMCKIKSYSASLPAYADGQTVVKTPLTVTVVPRKLRVIVGKGRRFGG